MTTLLYIAISIACVSLTVNFIALYMLFVCRSYLIRVISFGSGLADIQSMLKEMGLEHHTLVGQMIIDATEEIIKHVTYTNRWQKVMAKMIRVGGTAPMATATGSETKKEAEELHDIGLDIAKVAFDDKQDIEYGESGDKKEPPKLTER